MGNKIFQDEYKTIINEQNKIIKILTKSLKKNINKTYKDVEIQTETIVSKNIEIQTHIQTQIDIPIKVDKKILDTPTELIEIDDTEVDDTSDVIIYDNSKKQSKKDQYINYGKKWTDLDNKKLIDMYIAETDSEIMISTFGRSKYAIQCQLRRLIYSDYLICKDKKYIQKKYKITAEKLEEIIRKNTINNIDIFVKN